MNSADRQPVAPPVPAPYLAGIPQLPDNLLAGMDCRGTLSDEQSARALDLIYRLARRVRIARHRWGTQHGVTITPEPVLGE